MTDEQQLYIEQMKLWFHNEDNQNNITKCNIENADKMRKLYTIELKNKTELLTFDLARYEATKQHFNQWLIDNHLK